MTARIILEGISLDEHIELMRQVIREEIQKEREEQNLHLHKGEVCKILGIFKFRPFNFILVHFYLS
ncbi:MAG: hypothetical protein AB2L24_18530 [Mangrovibacterium sp.]